MCQSAVSTRSDLRFSVTIVFNYGYTGLRYLAILFSLIGKINLTEAYVPIANWNISYIVSAKLAYPIISSKNRNFFGGFNINVIFTKAVLFVRIKKWGLSENGTRVQTGASVLSDCWTKNWWQHGATCSQQDFPAKVQEEQLIVLRRKNSNGSK